MPKVTFETGQVVNFDSMPSQSDIDEVAQKLGIGGRKIEQPNPSMSTMGIKEYAQAHPFKTAFNDPVETITGKSMLERSQESPVSPFPPRNPSEIFEQTVLGTTRDLGALMAGGMASPASLATMGIGAIPAAGKTVAQAVAGSRVGQAVGKVLNTPMSIMPKPVESRIHSLYNYAVGTRLKNIGDVSKVQPNRIAALKSISDNLPDIKFTDIDTGESISRIPQNRLDLLQALKQTKQLLWDKVTTLSKGATAKGAPINLSKIVNQALIDTKKSIGSVALKTNPNLEKALEETTNSIRSRGTIFPTQAQDYLKFLNSEIQRLRQSGQAVDYSVKDLYNNLVGKLGDATDNAIERALQQSGYKDLRMQYSALKSSEKEILGAANKFLRQSGGQGGGVIHPIVNLWSIEDALQGIAEMSMGKPPTGFIRAIGIKTAAKLSDLFKNPDKRIPQMFKLLKQYSPKP